MVQVDVVLQLGPIACPLDVELGRPVAVSVQEGGEQPVLPEGPFRVEKVELAVEIRTQHLRGLGQRAPLEHPLSPLPVGAGVDTGGVQQAEQQLVQGHADTGRDVDQSEDVFRLLEDLRDG